jgi:hypothetical protein
MPAEIQHKRVSVVSNMSQANPSAQELLQEIKLQLETNKQNLIENTGGNRFGSK